MKLKYQEKFGPFQTREDIENLRVFCSKLAVWFFRNRRGGQIIYNMVRQVRYLRFIIFYINYIFQAEAVFNLSQLMFALYHGAPESSTFRDLNDPMHQVS